MSTAAMRPFLSALRRVERELTVPLPERVRILQELECDLEGLRERYLAAGLPPAEAEARALEALVPDGPALHALGRVHAPLYERLAAGVGERRLRMVERSALALITAAVLVGETLALLGADLLRDPAPFLWPVLALGAVLVATVTAEAFRLGIKREHGRAGHRLQAILVLAAAVFAAGLAGVFVDFFRVAATLEQHPERAQALLTPWVVRDCGLLAVATLLAMAGTLAWFVLTQWIVAMREARRGVLGLEH